jgi:hypothetical protein
MYSPSPAQAICKPCRAILPRFSRLSLCLIETFGSLYKISKRNKSKIRFLLVNV